MIQGLAHFLARLAIAIIGLPAIALETRKEEARRGAANGLGLYVGSMADDDDDGCDCDGVEARGIGFHVPDDEDDE